MTLLSMEKYIDAAAGAWTGANFSFIDNTAAPTNATYSVYFGVTNNPTANAETAVNSNHGIITSASTKINNANNYDGAWNCFDVRDDP